jgi:putative glycosyltransferase (TIGR04372 family)
MHRFLEKLAHFTANQPIKALRRHMRHHSALAPYNLIRHYLMPALVFYLVRPMALWLRRPASTMIGYICQLGIPARWLPKQLKMVIANNQFALAHRLLDENKTEASSRAFEKCVQYSNEPHHFMVAGVCLQVGLGRMREGIELYQQSNRIRLAHGSAPGASGYRRYCVLDHFWAIAIGHAAYIDYVVKLRMLEGCDPNDTILYVPPETKMANRFLVEQWEPHLRLITDFRKLPFSEEFVQRLAINYYAPDPAGVGRYYFWELAAQTYRRWAEEGRKPLLRLAEDVQDRGRKALASAGVPPSAWFVGLHVREPGYRPLHRELHDVLNAKIGDYLPAIDEIARRGGWVIRMGDPLMTPLPPLPNVLDYCHSAIRSDWMDIFLAATSRLFIGTSSGVCYVAQDYGVPCVLTNWWPPAQRPWRAGDIFIPKLLRRLGDGRVLSLEESLNEPFGYCNSVDYLHEKHGVTVQDNHPEEIRAAVVEMLERIDGRPNYDQDDVAMRNRAEGIYASVAMRLYDSPGAFGAAVLARDFLRRNPSFVAK